MNNTASVWRKRICRSRIACPRINAYRQYDWMSCCTEKTYVRSNSCTTFLLAELTHPVILSLAPAFQPTEFTLSGAVGCPARSRTIRPKMPRVPTRSQDAFMDFSRHCREALTPQLSKQSPPVRYMSPRPKHSWSNFDNIRRYVSGQRGCSPYSTRTPSSTAELTANECLIKFPDYCDGAHSPGIDRHSNLKLRIGPTPIAFNMEAISHGFE